MVRLGCECGCMWPDPMQKVIFFHAERLSVCFSPPFWPTAASSATSLCGGEPHASPIARAQWERDASTIRTGHGKRKASMSQEGSNSRLNRDALLDFSESSLPGDLFSVCRP